MSTATYFTTTPSAPMFTARVTISLRPSILDPQGKATSHALSQLGFKSIESVRIGKYIEISIDAASAEEARSIAEDACRKLLANSVMENFHVEIDEVEAVGS